MLLSPLADLHTRSLASLSSFSIKSNPWLYFVRRELEGSLLILSDGMFYTLKEDKQLDEEGPDEQRVTHL